MEEGGAGKDHGVEYVGPLGEAIGDGGGEVESFGDLG